MRTNTKTRKGRILNVALVTRYDESPDTSYIGEYTNSADNGVMVAETGEFYSDVRRRLMIINKCWELSGDHAAEENLERAKYWYTKAERLEKKWEDLNNLGSDRRRCSFFRPYAGGEPVGSKDWREYAKQDWQRITAYNECRWCLVGVIAEAEITLGGSDVVQRITGGGLWGIESDSGDACFAEIDAHELAGLKTELAALGFGGRAIAEAFKNVKHIQK